MIRKISFILSLLCTVAVCSAAVPLTLLDRTDGAAQLHKLLSRIWQDKTLKLPEDLDLEIRKISGEPVISGVANSLIVEESFAPAADDKLFVTEDYALLPVVVAVPLSFPVDDLSIEELKSIYSGRITALAKAPERVLRIAGCKSNTAQSRVFRTLVMKQELYSDVPVAPGSDILPDMLVCNARGAAALLEAFDNMIIFGSLELLTDCQNKYKILKINGIAPTGENVESKRYPLLASYRVRYLRSADSVQLRNMVKLLRRTAGTNREFWAIVSEK